MSSTLHLIVDGAIKLIRANSADRSIVVGIRSRGWLLGVPSFILDRPSAVTGVTLTDAEVRPISAVTLAKARTHDPYLNRWLAELLASEVVKHLETHDMTLLGARQRLV